MKKLSLSPRLQTLANLVGKKDVVADIGTDHGRLITWLALHNKIRKGYACDVKAGPLKKGRETIATYQMEDIITTVLTNGLKELERKNISAFIIAGMGGELIGEIILQAEWSHSDKFLFYLQPMTRDYVLRRTLAENGFEVTQEVPVICGKHAYTCMEVSHNGIGKKISLLESWTGHISHQSTSNTRAYFAQCYKLFRRMEPSFSDKKEYSEVLFALEKRSVADESKRYLSRDE